MMNWELIDNTTEQVGYFYECEGIMETSASIKARVIEWYEHSDIADIEVLSAAAYLGKYDPKITYDEILATRDMLFPQIPVELCNFHIGEIEEALNDELGWS